ncbi:hypothetical protein BC827DRAFT_43056 [Russula dissimulans]|nr:hypothetical protein BC827DRAFT_43056 [Russula dissimulans]
MPKVEEALIDKLTLRPEVREKARALLRTVRSKTGFGTGYDIGEAKTGLPAICAYIACKSAGYADITQEIAQKASCLAPRTFVSTLKTVKAALLSSSTTTTPNSSPSKSGNEADPTAYATLISEYKIGQPLRVESWMKEAHAALIALPRFRNNLASRLAESDAEVRIAVFFWVCRAIKLSTVQHVPLVDKHGVSLKTFSRLVKMMEDECVDLKESISATIKEMRKKKAKGDAGEDPTSSKTTPMSTPAQSRSASPTKSALRNANLTPALTSSAKRKVAFSLSDLSLSLSLPASASASEDDLAPETPSKRPRTRTTTTTPRRVLPARKADKDKSAESTSSEEAEAPSEDVEMSNAHAHAEAEADVDVDTPARTPTRTSTRIRTRTPRRLVASEPVAGPSTPRRPAPTTPTHAYRTPPSARIQPLSLLLLSGDGDDDDDEDEDRDRDGGGGVDEVEDAVREGEEAEASEDGALPPSRRFRPVFLDRAQWTQRAPRLARDRAAAERRMKELMERWGPPVELSELVAAVG